MTDAEMIAAFIAKKGVTKVAPDMRAMSERDMYMARRGELKGREGHNRIAAYDYLDRAVIVNADGELIAVE